ncbi:iron ABC transporter permease [Yoonia sp. BS5-3]|uniref:FecCD family ABC transporter permease n=1 Tax=Yoonia phaeophyticola TaxID=3137369 RepID=A0ABZ2VB70_9RHOB
MKQLALRFTLKMTLSLVVGMLLVLLSLRLGLRDISWHTVFAALSAFDANDPDHVTILQLRLPRALTACLGGAALGVAGALMQTMTRNPLADPGLLGINGGAAIGVVISIWGLGLTLQQALIAPALIGCAIAAAVVLFLGGAAGRNGPDPTRLLLAGAALNALFVSLTWAILILSRESLDVFRFWALGGFTGISSTDLMAVLPAYFIGFPLAFLTAGMLGPLVLGEEAAAALGVKVWLVRLLCVVSVVLLCGTTVSLAGPIAFIGLIVPHLVRPFVGGSVPRLVMASALAGALLAITADVLGRVIWTGREVEAGVLIALIGGPTLVVLVKTRWRAAV